MKKYLCMAVAGMFLFSACSNDDDAINSGNGNASADLTGQELIMKVANGGDGLTTRGGRPLYSSEAAQAIDKVKLAIFKLNDQDEIESCVFAKEFDNWNTTGSESYGGNTTNGSADHGRFASLNLKQVINGTAADKGLDPGVYTIYAVGYTSTESNYSYSPLLTDITDTWDDATNFKYVSATTTTKGEEIFAGEIGKITVDDKRNFTVVEDEPDHNILYLHRQVAGAFGYFKNIPVAGPDGTIATGLRLVASDKNTKLNMTAFNSDFRKTGENVAYVVNGSESATTSDAKFNNGADAYTVYEITLNKWFAEMDKNSDGVLNEKDTWTIPDAMKDQFSAIEGTVFGGEFVIPFANKNTSTFELQLIKGTGADAKILRRWTVNLGSVQPDVKGIDGNSIANIANENKSSYSIVRNHLYSIGRKDVAKPTDPTGPTDPENPEDLSKGQILTLRVNDNWEVIHKLEVEPEI